MQCGALSVALATSSCTKVYTPHSRPLDLSVPLRPTGRAHVYAGAGSTFVPRTFKGTCIDGCSKTRSDTQDTPLEVRTGSYHLFGHQSIIRHEKRNVTVVVRSRHSQRMAYELLVGGRFECAVGT
jgi:hypothetical protein